STLHAPRSTLHAPHPPCPAQSARAVRPSVETRFGRLILRGFWSMRLIASSGCSTATPPAPWNKEPPCVTAHSYRRDPHRTGRAHRAAGVRDRPGAEARTHAVRRAGGAHV